MPPCVRPCCDSLQQASTPPASPGGGAPKFAPHTNLHQYQYITSVAHTNCPATPAFLHFSVGNPRIFRAPVGACTPAVMQYSSALSYARTQQSLLQTSDVCACVQVLMTKPHAQQVVLCPHSTCHAEAHSNQDAIEQDFVKQTYI